MYHRLWPSMHFVLIWLIFWALKLSFNFSIESRHLIIMTKLLHTSISTAGVSNSTLSEGHIPVKKFSAGRSLLEKKTFAGHNLKFSKWAEFDQNLYFCLFLDIRGPHKRRPRVWDPWSTALMTVIIFGRVGER